MVANFVINFYGSWHDSKLSSRWEEETEVLSILMGIILRDFHPDTLIPAILFQFVPSFDIGDTYLAQDHRSMICSKTEHYLLENLRACPGALLFTKSPSMMNIWMWDWSKLLAKIY